MKPDNEARWKDEWASELTQAERYNLRSWGILVPDPPPESRPVVYQFSTPSSPFAPPAPPVPVQAPIQEQALPIDAWEEGYEIQSTCTENSHTAACTESTATLGLCNRRSRREL